MDTFGQIIFRPPDSTMNWKDDDREKNEKVPGKLGIEFWKTLKVSQQG